MRLGWFGMVAYALPILEVWLLTRLSERGATAFLVALQVVWVVALLGVLDRCLRGSPAYRQAAAQARADEETAARDEAEAEAYRAGARDAAGRRRPLRERRPRSPEERRRSHR